MKADLELIKQISCGAVSVIEYDGVIEFHRMTAAQENVLRPKGDFYQKSLASAGIRLEFETDAAQIRFSGFFAPIFRRKTAFFDIAVNGVLVHHEGTMDFGSEPEFDITLPLDYGSSNRVVIYFPSLAITCIRTLEFTAATTIKPLQKSCCIFCYGDSISQGATAHHPSLSYTNLLADALNARMYNKSICGGIFDPEFSHEPDTMVPQLITVAYGTNDWKKTTIGELEENARQFLDDLNRHYPGTPIAAITPIWRKDTASIQKAGTFQDVLALLNRIYSRYSNVTVIDGMSLTPHLTDFFEDASLHPDDRGFLLYGYNLLKHPVFDRFKNRA